MSESVIIPDYYLTTSPGFAGLEGVQRLYNVDLMALVSYDQVTYADDNKWSLGYLTVVGAYVVKDSTDDTTTRRGCCCCRRGERSRSERDGVSASRSEGAQPFGRRGESGLSTKKQVLGFDGLR